MPALLPSYYVILFGKDGNRTIRQVIESLLAQTVKPARIMIIDDGSKDGMLETVTEYAQKYPQLISVQETNSATRDFKRIPSLWNMGLLKGYDFHVIVPSDASLVPNYAERILKEMEGDQLLVIASGDWGNMKGEAPHGGGRFVRSSFFEKYYPDGYPTILGYESEILERAIVHGFKIKILNDLEIIHYDPLGHVHGFKEFGYGMKCLGYYPPYAFARIAWDFFYNDHVGKKGALKMCYHYLTFFPQETGYYSKYPAEIRRAVKERQKKMLKRVLVNKAKAVPYRLRRAARKGKKILGGRFVAKK